MYPDKFFQYYRMPVTSFDELLCLVSEKIRKNERRVRTAVYSMTSAENVASPTPSEALAAPDALSTPTT